MRTSQNLASTHSGEQGMEKGSGARTSGPQGVLARSLARYLEERDLVVLRAHYRSAGGMRDATTCAGQYFSYGLHNFFVLPECYTDQPAALSITEDDKLLEPV